MSSNNQSGVETHSGRYGKSSEVYGALSTGPYDVSSELSPRIDAYQLWEAVNDLGEHGYAILRDAISHELLDELRDALHAHARIAKPASSGDTFPVPLGQYMPVDGAVTSPNVLALAEYACGAGVRAGIIAGSIKRNGDSGLPLHDDHNWVPAPFPEQNLMITCCFACEGMTESGGATTVVPGTHRLLRHPSGDEVLTAETVPIELDKGDVAAWLGATWHGSGVRSIPGERTILHATYQRLYTQPVVDYTSLLDDEEYMKRAPEGMSQLLGGDLFFGTTTQNASFDMNKFEKTCEISRR